jgi:hypothetical protein
MTNVKMLPYQPGHLDFLDIRDLELSHIGEKQLAATAELGTCATLIIDGVPIALLGFFEHWKGVFEIFMIPGKHFRKHGKTAIPIIKRYLDSFFTVHGAHRLQTTAIADGMHDRWMEYIGFQCEGNLLKYSWNKVDYRIWARYK